MVWILEGGRMKANQRALRAHRKLKNTSAAQILTSGLLEAFILLLLYLSLSNIHVKGSTTPFGDSNIKWPQFKKQK